MTGKKSKTIPFLRPAATKFTLQNFLLLLLCGSVLADPSILYPPDNRMPDPNNVTPIGEFIATREDEHDGGDSLEIRDGKVTSAAFILAPTAPLISLPPSFSTSSEHLMDLSTRETQESAADDNNMEGSGEENPSAFTDLLTTSIPPRRNNSSARTAFPEPQEDTTTAQTIIPEIPQTVTAQINESTSKAAPQQVALTTSAERADQPADHFTTESAFTNHVTTPTIQASPVGRADFHDTNALTSSAIAVASTVNQSATVTSSTSETESAILPVVFNSTVSSDSTGDLLAVFTSQSKTISSGTTEMMPEIESVRTCDNSSCGENRHCYPKLDLVGPSSQRDALEACNCKEGFVLDGSTSAEAESVRRCYCPLSKIRTAGKCREANKVYHADVNLHLEPVDPTNGQTAGSDSTDTQRFLEAISQQFEQQEALGSLWEKSNMSVSISSQIVSTTSNTPRRRKRAETPDPNILRAEFLVKFLTSNSSALLPTKGDVVRALTTLDAELSSGHFVNSFLASKYRNVSILFNSSTVESFDYCEQAEHSCDVRSTECQFQESSARITCSCLPFHARVSSLECVFDVRLSVDYFDRIERGKLRLWIGLYVFIGLFAIFFMLAVAALLFVKARPFRRSKSPKLTRNGRIDSTVMEYEYRLPRPKLLPAFARNSQMVNEADGRNTYLSAAPVNSPYSEAKRVSAMNGTPQLLPSEPRRIGSTIVYNSPMHEMISLNSFSRQRPAPHSTSSILMNDNRRESSTSPSVEMPRSIASFSEEVARSTTPRPISWSPSSPSSHPLIDGGAIVSIADHVAAREAARLQRNSALADVLAQNNYVQSHV
ncbi:hypothetical protein RvY_02411 [Ramazzottius varieornatus]|uniref:EGF-like domain-containing protein n=1 Tax=Ramazzottius varieornatus TaxID=947166 RepID=A0A1D1URP8_RAMVA|nr:hypothetical protein RvY_02411 [Ramazzottius varieornatus]